MHAESNAPGHAAEERSAGDHALAASVVAAMGTMDQARTLVSPLKPRHMGYPAWPVAGTTQVLTEEVHANGQQLLWYNHMTSGDGHIRGLQPASLAVDDLSGI